MPCILLVEDSPTQARELAFLLADAGFEVETAADARQALERLARGGFDLVLTDLFLPGDSGIDLCRRVRADPAHRDIPVVLITRSTNPVNLLRGLEAGAADFLMKDRSPAEIASRLLRALRRPADTPGRVIFGGEEFLLTVERDRMLNVLLSAFEDLLQLHERNREELARRALAEEALQAARRSWSGGCAARTAELARANDGLRREVAEHRRTAQALERLRHQSDLILSTRGKGCSGSTSGGGSRSSTRRRRGCSGGGPTALSAAPSTRCCGTPPRRRLACRGVPRLPGAPARGRSAAPTTSCSPGTGRLSRSSTSARRCRSTGS